MAFFLCNWKSHCNNYRSAAGMYHCILDFHYSLHTRFARQGDVAEWKSKKNVLDVAVKRMCNLIRSYIEHPERLITKKFLNVVLHYKIIYAYTTLEDYQAGLTQLNNDIISGNMPDILIVNASLPMNNYVAKGLLADINDLIEGDEELSKRYYLTDEYRRSDFYYLPVQKDVFEEKSLEALERPYRLNSNGENEYYDEYFSMNGEEFLIEPLKK